MKKHYMTMVVLINAALQLSGCSEPTRARSATKSDAAKVEKIAGTELNRVILSEKAFQRLDIQTAPIRMEQVETKAAGNSSRPPEDTASPNESRPQRMVIPYSALLYDVNGKTWVYSSPAPLTFVRQPVTVDFIDGDRVVLVDGPATGTMVVAVGVAELYGSDTGVGK